MIRFEVPGNPQGKGRPKFARIGSFTKAYTPDETASYEEKIRGYAIRAGVTRLEGPLSMNLRAIREIPKSTSAKKRRDMEGKPCVTKPDADNVLKVVADALNGVAYRDDAQIAMASVLKVYGTEAKLMIEILPFDQTVGEANV